MTEGKEYISLKWGTVKGWDHLSDESVGLLRKYFNDEKSLSCMADHPDDVRKKILCDLIAQLDGEIFNDWTGENMTAEEAKKYVLEY